MPTSQAAIASELEILRAKRLGDVLDRCPDDLAAPLWDATLVIAAALAPERQARVTRNRSLEELPK